MTSSLIPKLEEAREGSRELDKAVAEHFGLVPKGGWFSGGMFYTRCIRGDGNMCPPLPALTTSIDAALALAERVLGKEWTVEIKTGPTRTFHRAIIHPSAAYENKQGRCPMGLSRASVPIALCIAILRSAQQKETTT